jgi:septal ring factor EnvC (AmiA/AmiB activator)
MQEQLNKMERAITRIETKLDYLKESNDDFDKRITNLERKYWTALGAFALSVLSWLKTMFNA